MPARPDGGDVSRNRPASPADVVRETAPTGVALGVASFLATYVLTYAYVVLDGVDTSDGGWTLVGLVLYSAHNVETVTTATGAGQTISGSVNLLSNDFSGLTSFGSTVPTIVYYLTPVVVLLVAGFLTVQWTTNRSGSIATGALAGATVVLGYLAFAVLGPLLFRVSRSAFGAQATVAPDLVTGIALLGIAYPVVFGAIGGAAASS